MFKQNKLIRIVSNYIQEVYMQPEAQYDASDCLTTDNPGQEPLHPMGEPGEKTVLTIMLRSVAKAVSSSKTKETDYEIGAKHNMFQNPCWSPGDDFFMEVRRLQLDCQDDPTFD